MMKIGNLNIGWRLGGGFLFVIVLALIAGFVSINAMQKLAGLTRDLYDHSMTVGNAVRDIRMNITAMHRSMKDVALANNIDGIRAAAAIVDAREKETVELFNIVLDRFPGNKQVVKESLKEFTGWKVIRDKVIRLMVKGERQAAADITKGMGARYIEHLLVDINAMIDFANKKGASFYKSAQATRERVLMFTLIITGMIFLLSITVAVLITRSITVPINEMVKGVKEIARGNFERPIKISQNDEVGGLGRSINEMTDSLRKLTADAKRRDWIKTGQNELSGEMSGDLEIGVLADNVIRFLVEYLDAKTGALYVLDREGAALDLTGGYAFDRPGDFNERFGIKEGLVGQAAHSKKMISLTDIPEDYMRIRSAAGEAVAANIVVVPFIHEDQVVGVMELGAFRKFSDTELEFLDFVMDSVAIAINSARSRDMTRELLENTRLQAEELEVQQEELRSSNEELEEQTQRLMASEEELKSQQNELQLINKELEEKTQVLEAQQDELAEKNRVLRRIKMDLERKAEELATTSRYKSEFLANMSHELRTPLNSLLILAQDLAANKEGNLNDDQLEAAAIVYNSGKDLLKLINEILDLAKVEAGKMTLNVEEVEFSDIADSVHANFKHLAEEAGLKLEVKTDKGLPRSIKTDPQRLDQIIKNLVSNAIKFTEKGGVTVRFHKPGPDTDLSRSALAPEKCIAVTVADTGPGIPGDKRLEIFEAFQQVDGGTARKYGGTGLGLSISRELARLLGGEIQLESGTGPGAAFTVYLPVGFTPAPPVPAGAAAGAPGSPLPAPSIDDDRESIEEKDKVLLVIEDEEVVRNNIIKLIGDQDIETVAVDSGEEALEKLSTTRFDCIILDLNLSGMSGFEFLERLHSEVEIMPPVIVYTGRELTREEEYKLKRYALSVIVKGEKSEERLLDETALFLHRVVENLPERKREMIKSLYDMEEHFTGKKVLVADDDMRNILALSKVLEHRGMEVFKAVDGEKALAILDKEPGIDLVLLDIMMPVMDGYEVMDRIRAQPRFKDLPVIAVTAKAMKADREKCMDAGATDYISKPVDINRLLNILRVWLYR
ncbi:MAG: response regulator [Desulfobacterales bacterium]|nr:response regulator [Desulfobacterales bacterium]